METPSSIRRVTRSQTSNTSQKSKQEESLSRSRTSGNRDRPALLDITNDSPIVGLATGSLVEKTPLSSAVKSGVRAKRTPGSGEALLRGQVKTLLQKVEEEAELVNKSSCGHPAPLGALLGLSSSPALLLAPTPANTPQVADSSGLKEDHVSMDAMMPSVTKQDPKIIQPVAAALEQEEILGECVINRALLFDSPGKSGVSDTTSVVSSSLTYQGSESSCAEKSPEDDSSSLWSIQVNASTQEDDAEYFGEVEVEACVEDDEDVVEDEESLDDLCEGLSKMSVMDERVRLPEFAGKHTRFLYNSDDEIEEEDEEEEASGNSMAGKAVSPGALVLKGMPAPQGKHLRFQEEDED